MTDELRVQVIELRGSGGLGVFLRVDDDQRLFRVAPVRDPNQPRFWCLAVFECSSCGIPVTGSAIWAGAWGSAHHELSGMLDTIKDDVSAWLAEQQCAQLLELLRQPRPPLPLPMARQARREPERRSAESAAAAAADSVAMSAAAERAS